MGGINTVIRAEPQISLHWIARQGVDKWVGLVSTEVVEKASIARLDWFSVH